MEPVPLGRIRVSRTRSVLLLIAASLTLACCSEDGASIDTASLSEEGRACLMGANAMIDVAREAVADTRSRPERRESRRELMEDWVARLEEGEDPCSVYGEIGRAATAF